MRGAELVDLWSCQTALTYAHQQDCTSLLEERCQPVLRIAAPHDKDNEFGSLHGQP